MKRADCLCSNSEKMENMAAVSVGNVNPFGVVTEFISWTWICIQLWPIGFHSDRLTVIVELRKMSHSPLDKIQALDAIEKEIINCVQSAGK